MLPAGAKVSRFKEKDSIGEKHLCSPGSAGDVLLLPRGISACTTEMQQEPSHRDKGT